MSYSIPSFCKGSIYSSEAMGLTEVGQARRALNAGRIPDWTGL